VPPSPNVALGRWLVCRVIQDNIVVTEEGELVRFADLSKERAKNLILNTTVELSDPMAPIVDAVTQVHFLPLPFPVF